MRASRLRAEEEGHECADFWIALTVLHVASPRDSHEEPGESVGEVFGSGVFTSSVKTYERSLIHAASSSGYQTNLSVAHVIELFDRKIARTMYRR
jgi:hypothetical protein